MKQTIHYILFALAVLFGFACFCIACFVGFFWAVYIFAAEPENKYITIEDDQYTVSYEFEMSASVEPNDCNTCIKYQRPSKCLDVCSNIISF
jgi:hypothetical protein